MPGNSRLPPRLSALLSSVLATLSFLYVIWASIDFSKFDRMDYAGTVPGALALGWVWFLLRNKRGTRKHILLSLCAFFIACFVLGMVQEMVISRTRELVSTDRYDFIVGPAIPALIAAAAWCFIKEKPDSRTAP
jgi:hypothetical protein